MTHEKGILWLVLDDASQAALKARCTPRYENEFYHHLTLRFGVTLDAALESFVGTPQIVEAYAEAHNAEAQAVRVNTIGLPDEYGAPHITLSTARDVKPFASVAMLQGAHTEVTITPPLKLTGTIAFEPLSSLKNA